MNSAVADTMRIEKVAALGKLSFDFSQLRLPFPRAVKVEGKYFDTILGTIVAHMR